MKTEANQISFYGRSQSGGKQILASCCRFVCFICPLMLMWNVPDGFSWNLIWETFI